MSEVLYLSGGELSGLASYGEYVESVTNGYRQRGAGSAASSPTTISTKGATDDYNSYINTYTAHLSEDGVAGTYQFSVDREDRWYIATLYDSTTGQPVALLDGGSWMSTKTGAIAAVGADALARSDATTVGIIGSGRVARESLRAFCEVREIERVDVYSRTEANRESFAAAMEAELDRTVVPVSTEAAALSGRQRVDGDHRSRARPRWLAVGRRDPRVCDGPVGSPARTGRDDGRSGEIRPRRALTNDAEFASGTNEVGWGVPVGLSLRRDRGQPRVCGARRCRRRQGPRTGIRHRDHRLR